MFGTFLSAEHDCRRSDLYGQRDQEQHHADEEKGMTVHTAIGDLAHFRSDCGRQGAHGCKERSQLERKYRGIADYHHHGHSFADGAPDQEHDGREHAGACGGTVTVQIV